MSRLIVLTAYKMKSVHNALCRPTERTPAAVSEMVS